MRKNLVSLRASYRSVWMAQQYSGGALEVGGSALVEKQLNPVASGRLSASKSWPY